MDCKMMDDVQRILITGEQIQARVKELAEQINRDYQGKELVIVGILKGAVIFCSQLLTNITLPVALDFMSISSYGTSTKSSGVVRILKDLDSGIENKHVLVVEDIVDTGLSLKYIAESLLVRAPASVKVCALLDKPSRRKTDVQVDYLGFSIPDEFAVGYGLDYAERYRNLSQICVLKPEVYSQ